MAAAESSEAKLASAPVRSERNAPPEATTANRDVVRRAELTVRVPNVEAAEREANRLVKNWGGYVESATSTDLASDHPSLTMALRVPVRQFDLSIAAMEALGVRLSKTVSSEDVTGQLVDLDARLKTLRAHEDTLRGLLRATRDLNSTISLQDKLTEVRSTIESMAAQRKTLGGLAALSTVTLRFEQDASPAASPKDPNWLAQTWGESTNSMASAMRVLTTLGVYTIVFTPLWLPVVWLLRRSILAVRP